MIGSDDDVVLFDTNILVYARDIESPNYKKAKELQDSVNNGNLIAAITPQNLLEFYSVITNQAKNKKADSSKEAIAEIKKYLLSPFELIVPTGKELGIIAKLLKGRDLIGRRIFDVYLVATMLSNGIRTIYTANERDFEMFGEIKAVNPFK
jgi:predicted nucleic acid-binding protein